MSEFRMPSLGSDMEFGTIVEWRVKPGDSVKRGDVVALVETEKGVIEVEIFEEGVIDALQVEPGKKVPVGTPLATLTRNEAAPVGAAKAEYLETPAKSETPLGRDEADTEKPEAPPADAAPIPAPSLELPGRPRISPYARKRAQELGVPIEQIAASGGHGAIVAADIERAAAAKGDKGDGKPTDAAARKADAQAAMRKVIATAMARAKREIPHYYLSTTIDLSAALNWLASANANRPVTKRVIYSALLLRAVALAAREVPEMNGFYKNEGFEPSATVNLGVAIGLRQGGLVNPAIHDADQLTLDALMERMLDMVNRARTGRLRSSEISDGTITVTNLGEQGVERVFGVIYPPQVALVGFGKIVERPWARQGMLGVKPTIDATLSADHRVSDGHRGGRFLQAIDRWLQEPEKL